MMKERQGITVKQDCVIVLAPDSFKESMTAKEVCEAMERGIKKGNPKVTCIHVPMMDGGDGIEVLYDQGMDAIFGIVPGTVTLAGGTGHRTAERGENVGEYRPSHDFLIRVIIHKGNRRGRR